MTHEPKTAPGDIPRGGVPTTRMMLDRARQNCAGTVTALGSYVVPGGYARVLTFKQEFDDEDGRTLVTTRVMTSSADEGDATSIVHREWVVKGGPGS